MNNKSFLIILLNVIFIFSLNAEENTADSGDQDLEKVEDPSAFTEEGFFESEKSGLESLNVIDEAILKTGFISLEQLGFGSLSGGLVGFGLGHGIQGRWMFPYSGLDIHFK